MRFFVCNIARQSPFRDLIQEFLCLLDAPEFYAYRWGKVIKILFFNLMADNIRHGNCLKSVTISPYNLF